MGGFQSLDKFNLSQRRLERSALAASGLPRSTALESHRVKELAERLEFFSAGDMADCGDALDHSIQSLNVCSTTHSIEPGPEGSSGGLYSLSSSLANSTSCCATCSRTPPIISLVSG